MHNIDRTRQSASLRLTFAWIKGESGRALSRTFAITVRYIRPLKKDGKRIDVRDGGECEEGTMRFLPAPGRLSGRLAVRPAPASPSSLLPLPGPPTVPRPRWECPLRGYSANSPQIPRRIRLPCLSPLFPATRRGNDVRWTISNEKRDDFVRTVLYDARYSLVVYHGERSETTTVCRCGWVGRSLAAKARWRCASAAAAVNPAGQSHRAVRLSARSHARRGQSITWRERRGFKLSCRARYPESTILAIGLTN